VPYIVQTTADFEKCLFSEKQHIMLQNQVVCTIFRLNSARKRQLSVRILIVSSPFWQKTSKPWNKIFKISTRQKRGLLSLFNLFDILEFDNIKAA
jgi:hypothetical protein